jgi:hypothetical protein
MPLAPVPIIATRLPVRAGEIVYSRDVRDRRTVELTDRADEGVGLDRFGAPVRVAHCDVPAVGDFVENRLSQIGFESNIPADIVLIRHPLHICPQLVPFRKMLRPIVVRFEGQRVEVIGGIDAAPGITVFQPCAADGPVFLDNDEGDASLLHLDRHAEARHAGTDDDRLEGVKVFRFGSPMYRLRIAFIQHCLFADHRHVFFRDRSAYSGR